VDADSVVLEHVMWLDGDRVAASSGSKVTFWQVTEDPPVYAECGMFAANPAGRITCLAASPDGCYLAAACANNTVSQENWSGWEWIRECLEGV
jgi:hypothetical protein